MLRFLPHAEVEIFNVRKRPADAGNGTQDTWFILIPSDCQPFHFLLYHVMTSKDLVSTHLLKIKTWECIFNKTSVKVEYGELFYFYDVSSLRELPG